MNPRSRLNLATLVASLSLAAGMAPSTGPGSSPGLAKAQAQTNANQTPDRAPPQRTVATDAAMLRWLNGGRTTRRVGYPAPGWTVAHDRRMAKKRRNQLRNRRAHRGGGR